MIVTVLHICLALAEPAAGAGTLVKEGQAHGCIVVPEGTEKGRVLTAVEDLAA